MTTILINYLMWPEPLHTPERAAEVFDLAATSILPTGRSGQVLWVRPPLPDEDTTPGGFRGESYRGSGEGLRIEIDVDVDRAALTWLPDETIAVELPPGPELTVMWSVDDIPRPVPGELVRVSAATARRAVVEYVTTGERPTRGLRWEPAPPAA